MCNGMCVCVRAGLQMWLCLKVPLFHLTYFLWTPGAISTELRRAPDSHVWCRTLMHCKHLPGRKQAGQDVGTPKTRFKGEVCLYMWLSLWPLTQRWAIYNPNKRRHPGDFSALHSPTLNWNGQLLTLLSTHLATSEVTCFPLRTVYHHHSIFP